MPPVPRTRALEAWRPTFSMKVESSDSESSVLVLAFAYACLIFTFLIRAMRQCRMRGLDHAPHILRSLSIRRSRSFAPFLSIDQFIQIPAIHLESFPKSRIWKRPFPNQLAHRPQCAAQIMRSFG